MFQTWGSHLWQCRLWYVELVKMSFWDIKLATHRPGRSLSNWRCLPQKKVLINAVINNLLFFIWLKIENNFYKIIVFPGILSHAWTLKGLFQSSEREYLPVHVAWFHLYFRCLDLMSELIQKMVEADGIF